MEFWGCELKPGAPVSCTPGAGFVIHLSQAALGETKKGSENVLVFVKVGDKKLVLGTLSADKHPQISCDLIFDDTFELSHNSKTTSVFLCGYKSVMPDMFESGSDEEEEEELEANANHVQNNAPEKTAAKVPVKEVKDKQNESDSDSSSDSDDMSDSDMSDSDADSMSADMSSGSDDSKDEDDSDDDSEDDSEDEETPVPEVGKKRTAATPSKTPASDKKAKISTLEKETGNKKGVHIATPHPAKHASKTPADGKQKEKGPKTPADSKAKAAKTPADSKAKDKSPKSGSHACKSCSKTFNSAGALESHQKAKKHEA